MGMARLKKHSFKYHFVSSGVFTLALLNLSSARADEISLLDSMQMAPTVNQNDFQLRDLFGADGSQLCAPASIAHRILSEKYRSAEKFNQISLPGNTGPESDPALLIRWLVEVCSTDKNNGTTSLNYRRCAEKAFDKVGMGNFHFRSLLEDQRRWKSFIEAIPLERLPAFVQVGFYKMNPPRNELHRVGGHMLTLYRVRSEFGNPQFETEVYDPFVLPGETGNAKYLTTLVWEPFKAPSWLKTDLQPDYTLSNGSFPADEVLVLLDDVYVSERNEEK